MVAPVSRHAADSPSGPEHRLVARQAWAGIWPLPDAPMPRAYASLPSGGGERVRLEGRTAEGQLLAWLEVETLPGGEAALRTLAALPDDSRAGPALDHAWQEARRWLEQSGARRVWSGGGMAHLWPGLPAARSALSDWLESQGFADAGETWDMVTDDLQAARWSPAQSPRDIAWDLADTAAAAMAIDWLQTEFPSRWPLEVADTLAGVWPGSRLLLGRSDGKPVAFALLHLPGSDWTWRWQGAVERPAAMGPLGVDRAWRGKGLGYALMETGLKLLQSEGARATIIDWTTLTTFYGAFGFWPRWRWSRRALVLRP